MRSPDEAPTRELSLSLRLVDFSRSAVESQVCRELWLFDWLSCFGGGLHGRFWFDIGGDSVGVFSSNLELFFNLAYQFSYRILGDGDDLQYADLAIGPRPPLN